MTRLTKQSLTNISLELMLVVAYAAAEFDGQCVPAAAAMCTGSYVTSVKVVRWPYNHTIYPNFDDAASPATVRESLNRLHPLVATECSAYVQVFLCAVHSPVCTAEGVVPPCAELCERVRDDCRDVIEAFGIRWPDRLGCERFPSSAAASRDHRREAIEPVSSDGGVSTIVSRSHELLWSREYLLDGGKICIPPSEEDVVTPAVMRIQREQDEQSTSAPPRDPPDLGIWCPADLRAPPSSSGFRFMGLVNCSAPCPNMYLTGQQVHLVRYFVVSVAIVCLAVTTFILLTFAIDTKRFRYPERPIIFYASSYFVISLLFLVGFALREHIPCNNKIMDESNEVVQGFTVVEGTNRRICTTIFMLLYFFTVNGTIWWLILTCTWLLAAAFKWGSEAIEKYAVVYHAIAWCVPAVQTTVALIFGKVEGDNITGLCYVGLYDSVGLRYMLLLPMCTYLLIGCAILITGFLCLNRVRKILQGDEENKQKLAKFMLRIGIFSALFILPQIILIAVYVVEDTYRTSWEAAWYAKTCHGYSVPCPASSHPVGVLAIADHQPSVFLFCLKYGMTLIVALPPLFWVASRKTCNSWANFLSRPPNCCGSSSKLNNTATCLLNESNGPHAKDARHHAVTSQVGGDVMTVRDDVFGEMTTGGGGSSASVAAACSTARQRMWGGWNDDDDDVSDSSFSSYTSSDSESSLSRVLADDMRKHHGKRVVGRRKLLLPPATSGFAPAASNNRRGGDTTLPGRTCKTRNAGNRLKPVSASVSCPATLQAKLTSGRSLDSFRAVASQCGGDRPTTSGLSNTLGGARGASNLSQKRPAPPPPPPRPKHTEVTLTAPGAAALVTEKVLSV